MFSKWVHLESGDDKLCFFEVALVEVVDDDIRVEEHFFEKGDLLGLNRTNSTSMTLRTPCGTLNLLLAMAVPTIRLGFSGWRVSLRSR